MSSFGFNSSRIGNPNGFSRVPPTHPYSNPNNQVQEHCVICHRVFSNILALINHYDIHIRGDDEIMNLRNNNMLAQNQDAASPPPPPPPPQDPMRLALVLGRPSRNLLPPSFIAPDVPPIAFRRTHDDLIQQRQSHQPLVPGPIRRRSILLGRRNNTGNNMIRPARARAAAAVAAATQPNQPAAAVPEVIDLEFGDEENNTIDGGTPPTWV